MSEADKLFDYLGYKIYHNDDETLIYKHQSDFYKTSITFDKRDFKKTVSATTGYWVANDSEKWVTQEFKNDFDKFCSANGYWSNMWHEFTAEELQAIYLKYKEFGWIKE